MYQYYEWIFSDLHETANHPLHCAPWLAVLYMDWNAVYLWECVYSRTKCFLESSGCRTRPLETSAYRPRLSDCGTNRERTLVWNGVQNPPRRSLLGGYVLILWMTMHVMSLSGAYVLIHSQLQIGWHCISRLFLQLFQRTRILPMGFTIITV